MNGVSFSLIGLFLVSGCATIVNGTTQKIPVSSNPVGARVDVDGKNSYTTPCTIEMARKCDHLLTFSSPGYRSMTFTVEHKLSGMVAGNILLGGFIGAGVDAVSGGTWRLAPETINITLEH